ncbi:MAG: DUF5119 domain-containing protein [Muribaculaceae bacterium]|nr:DUF5119 domain-containing protein [Muribaculaceae bacterium]
MKSTIIMVITSLAMQPLSSCDNQQELCFAHNHDRIPVKVVFDWSECPDANPQTMSLYLFSKDGYRRHEFEDKNGGKILVVPDAYTAIAVNSDNNTVKINNSGRAEDFEIALRDSYEQQGLSSKTDRPLCFAPDSLWISYIDEIAIKDNKIVVPMAEAVCRYSVEIKHLKNSNLVSSIDGALSGMHGKLSFGNREDNSEPTDIMFSFERQNGSEFYCEFFTLGHCGLSRTRSDANEHKIDFNFTLGDGSRRRESVIVTEQLHNQPTDRCRIVIDTLDLPLYTSQGSMNTSVEEWISDEFIITLNK